ncbi:hypothetical protein ABIB80_007035 [Bradyrhizobium sp. i1.15.2]|uniref:hypothetical protein n=1 Tax=Bradyrhizobium sp. i1.15.2 TaxID=3156362 RepID=UPI003396C005
MSHFMMDCYFPDVTKPDGVTCDSFPIKALNDDDAIAEAKRVAIWKKPLRYGVLIVSKAGDKTIFHS